MTMYFLIGLMLVMFVGGVIVGVLFTIAYWAWDSGESER